MIAAPVSQVVPRCFPGETVVCLGTGPSLIREDVASCQGRARVLAIKDAIFLAPWADVLYACGRDGNRWWQRHGDALNFSGLRYTLDPAAARWASVLTETGVTGLELDPGGLKTGRNSGFQAINLAVHLGASRIILLGYDMQASADGRHHFFEKPTHPPYATFLPLFATLLEPLARLGVQVMNATPGSALESFPRTTLAEAWP